MRCVLGFDGGGTKTECVLMDETGRVLSRGRSGPSNPFRVGVESASEALQSAARDALQSAGRAIHEVAAVVAGLAGTTRHDLAERMRADLSRLFPGSAVKLCTDSELALEAVGESPAIVLVAGTGSAAIGRDAAGRVVRIGGFWAPNWSVSKGLHNLSNGGGGGPPLPALPGSAFTPLTRHPLHLSVPPFGAPPLYA